MQITNSLTKSKYVLPDEPIRIYSCGPTVYDNAHIGNLLAFITADTLRRVVSLSGQDVQHVMNITDIDDKTIQSSKELYPDLPPEEALTKLTQAMSQEFMSDIEAVGIDVGAIKFINATDYINQMQAMIKKIVESGIGYIAEDGIYFSIKKYLEAGKPYGIFHPIKLSSSQARINNDEYEKDAAQDFALWKKQVDTEPSWKFDLDGQDLRGRPGWHIECSAMSIDTLGQNFHIHTGGVDLQFPHHENEVAQALAAGAETLTQSFMHNAHLLVNDTKMSKSLGNFWTLKDIENKGFSGLDFRMLVLLGRYNTARNVSEATLQEAKNIRLNLAAFTDLRHQTIESDSSIASELSKARTDIINALQDDLSTPVALGSLIQLTKEFSNKPLAAKDLEQMKDFIEFLDDALGLQLGNSQDITDDQKQAIQHRSRLLKEASYEEADTIRQELLEQSIQLQDLPDKTTIWKRI